MSKNPLDDIPAFTQTGFERPMPGIHSAAPAPGSAEEFVRDQLTDALLANEQELADRDMIQDTGELPDDGQLVAPICCQDMGLKWCCGSACVKLRSTVGAQLVDAGERGLGQDKQCMECGADPGQPCSVEGRELYRQVHAVRQRGA